MRGKRITIVLSILVAAIWGSIVDKLIGAMGNSRVIASGEYSTIPRAPTVQDRFEFKSIVRDPFAFEEPSRRTMQKRIVMPQVAPSAALPSLKLSGVLTMGKRGTAMIESVEGRVFFLREGDTLQGVRILRIRQNAVTYLHLKKQGEWTVER